MDLRLPIGVAATLIALCLTDVSAFSAKRLALVIGNGEYLYTERLRHPPGDAKAFAEFIGANGFEVTTVLDANRPAMSSAVSAFIKSLGPDDVALFYYSGHGMQQEGLNYLVSVDAKLQSEFDVASETIALNAVIAALERSAKVALIFIDASRPNPLADRLGAQRGASEAKAVRGLARIEPSGAATVVALAAKPGEPAPDGEGANSPFTGALIRFLAAPGIEISTAFKRVIQEVRKTTEDRQSPQMVSNLAEEFYLDDGSRQAAANEEQAKLDYGKAERIGTFRAWQLFLTKYPTGFHADLARDAQARLAENDPSLALSPEAAEKSLKLNGTRIREVELALEAAGVAVAPDGAFDKDERVRIASFQKSLGIADTGFVDQPLLSHLRVASTAGAGDEAVQSGEARSYKAADLEGLETDRRLIDAIRCLGPLEVTYGFYKGHVYIAAYSFGITWAEANNTATTCRGHLVTFAERGEEKFVIALFEQDERFLNKQEWTDRSGTRMLVDGPHIGLVQDPKGREPRGGWRWVTGEPLRYTNWHKDQPNEWEEDSDVTSFFASRPLGPGEGAPPRAWDDRRADMTTNSFIMEVE